MPNMTRNPSQPGVSNWEARDGSYVQFYEQRYSTPGPQEWIFAPDAGPMYVTLYFVNGAGSAFLEGSDEAPNDISMIPPNSVVAALPYYNNDHKYPLTDTVVDTTRVKVEGCTAVRVNVLGGSVDVTVRV
jgi:hypothetical protein